MTSEVLADSSVHQLGVELAICQSLVDALTITPLSQSCSGQKFVVF